MSPRQPVDIRSAVKATKCRNILKVIEWPAWVMHSRKCRAFSLMEISYNSTCNFQYTQHYIMTFSNSILGNSWWTNLNNLSCSCGVKTTDSPLHLNFAFAVCVRRSPEVCESVNDTGIIYQAQIVGHKSKFYPYRCRMKPVIQISYRLDPTLTVMLSLVCYNTLSSYFLLIYIFKIIQFFWHLKTFFQPVTAAVFCSDINCHNHWASASADNLTDSQRSLPHETLCLKWPTVLCVGWDVKLCMLSLLHMTTNFKT